MDCPAFLPARAGGTLSAAKAFAPVYGGAAGQVTEEIMLYFHKAK